LVVIILPPEKSEVPRGKPRGIFAEPCVAKGNIIPVASHRAFAYSAVKALGYEGWTGEEG